MSVQTLRLRPAGMDDAKRLFDWANDPDTREASLVTSPDDWEDHLIWLERSLARTDRLLFIGEATRTDQAIGQVRFDALDPALWEINVTVAPAYRGRGWARKLLAAGLDHCGQTDFLARVRTDNLRSRSLFEGLGFTRARQAEDIVLYRLTRHEAAA